MATKPTITPTWATDLNFASGPETGIATKVDPGAGARAQGYIAEEQVSSREWNHERNLIGAWIEWLEQERASISLAGLIAQMTNWASADPDNNGMAGTTAALSTIRTMAHSVDGAAVGTPRWVAGRIQTGAEKVMVYSDQLTQWTVSSTEPANIGTPLHPKSLIYSDVAGLWICSLGLKASSPGGIITSADGLTWTARTTHDATAEQHYAVAENGSVIVVAGTHPDFWSSTNGTAWTQRTNPTANDMHGIAWSSTLSLFVAVGAAGTILTSPDAITWTSRTSGTTDILMDVLWEPVSAKFIVCSSDTGRILTSTDGITWTNVGTPIQDFKGDSPDLSSLAHDGLGNVLACGNTNVADSVSMAYSADGGATWSSFTPWTPDAVSAPGGGTPLGIGVRHENSRFIFFGRTAGSEKPTFAWQAAQAFTL